MKKDNNLNIKDLMDLLCVDNVVIKDNNGNVIDTFPANQVAESIEKAYEKATTMENRSDEDMPVAEPVHEPMPEMIFDNDKYIDPAIRELRDLEDDFPPMFKTALDMSRVNNAGIVNRMAEEMTDLYKTHLSTLLEYNTQYTAQCVMSLRDELMYYLESLVKKK